MKANVSDGIFVWLMLLAGMTISASAADIPATDDWNLEAAEAKRSGSPILVLFSNENCGYCERLKKEVLEPLMRCGELRKFARIREIDIGRGGKITDFDGEKIRTRAFVKRYGIYATPTLLLVDYQGNSIDTPIVGFDNREDYMSYLAHFMGVAYRKPGNLTLSCGEQVATESGDEDHREPPAEVTRLAVLQ